MALTPETLTRHELIGLRIAVADAPNPDLVGICGRVVGETMRTLRVAGGSASPSTDGHAGDSDGAARVRQVPKRGSTFEFELPARGSAPDCTDEAAGVAKVPGTASKLRSETAGRFEAGQSGRCQGAAYVTVDGTRLLSRPALRTEKRGDSLWR